MRDLYRQQNEVGDKARRRGFRDVVTGKAGTDEITDAQNELATGVVNQAESSGRVNKAQADALRESLNVMGQQARKLDSVEQDLRRTQQGLLQLQGRGMNQTQRDQTMGM